jgi:hypothetical protein
MPFSPIATVKHRLKPGSPVPFNIHHADHTLLLARGQLLRDEAQIEALFERNAVVDADEIKGPCAEAYETPPEQLPTLWNWCITRIAGALRNTDRSSFVATLHEAAQPVLVLIERDPDLAIFQVVRPANLREIGYGASHAVHAAIASHLVARRMGWDKPRIGRVFKAALTMNLAILDLQTRLAAQTTPLTAVQREALRHHPQRSVEMLKAAGVADAEWLGAIDHHHDAPGGAGPAPVDTAVADMAALLRCVDIYTAKLSARATRSALPANRAGRELFMQDAKSAIAAAVIKEFGIFPPGCFITLQSGEVGVVIKRGATANTPVVASLTGRSGDALLEPVRRHTDAREHAIVSVVAESSLRVRVAPEKLAALAAR